MWLVAYVSLALAVVWGYIATQNDAGASAIRVNASEEIKQYKSFMAAADSFFAKGDQQPLVKFQWAQIQGSAPPGIQSARMNPVWYAIKAEDGTWAACTDISEEAMAGIAKLFPEPEVGMKLQMFNGLLAVGETETAFAAAALCQKGAT